MNWINARKQLPPPSDRPVRYLAILDTNARAQHCKIWGGMGEPEVATFCSLWKPYPWSARGDLSVAYWMPMPKFSMRWDKTVEGELGRWVECES